MCDCYTLAGEPIPTNKRYNVWNHHLTIHKVFGTRADLHRTVYTHAKVKGIPRIVLLDLKTRSNLLQWPVKEVESLRASSQEFTNITISSGSVVPLDVRSATQLDIEAEFVIDAASLAETLEADVGYNCSTSGGATHRGALGSFGLLVLADPKLSEQTAVYFYIAKRPDGGLQTHFCHDEMKSSHANDIYKRMVGNKVPMLDGETLSLRILVHYYVQSHIQINEYRDRIVLPAATRKHGRHIGTCIKILDMTGLKFSALSQIKFCNEYAVPKDQLDLFKDVTPKDIVCSQKATGVTLKEEDVAVSKIYQLMKEDNFSLKLIKMFQNAMNSKSILCVKSQLNPDVYLLTL